jgi:predicted MFS family arabinose efflux permease
MSVALGIEQARPREEAPPPLTRQPAFVRFWAAKTISVFGDQISALAIPLTAVLALDASALEVGILTALAWLPHLLFSLPLGVWIDRRAHRRENMIVADILRALALATIPVAWWLGALTIWQLLGVAFAVGAMTVFFDLSSASFFVALVHRSQYVDANSKLSTSHSLSYIAGPSTAGFLVQVFTAPVALLADALSFVASAVALRGVRVEELRVESNGTSARADLVDGFRYLARQPVLRAGVICTSIINFFSFFIFAIFVLYASRSLGLSAAAIGVILGAASFGALAGALIAPRVGRRLGIGRAVVLGAVLFPAPMALFPLAHGGHWLAGSMLLAGEFLASVGVMIFDVNQNSLSAMIMPNEVRSRVVGVSRFFNYGTRPFGALLGGVLGAWIGLRPTLWIGVLGCLLGVFFLLASPMPQMREEDLA